MPSGIQQSACSKVAIAVAFCSGRASYHVKCNMVVVKAIVHVRSLRNFWSRGDLPAARPDCELQG